MGCAIYTTKKIGQDWANPEPVVIAIDSGVISRTSRTKSG